MREARRAFDDEGIEGMVRVIKNKLGDDADNVLREMGLERYIDDAADNLLNPRSWQEAESMLREYLGGVPKNTEKFFVEGMSKARIPDIVTDAYIADAKLYRATDLTLRSQIRDFVQLAIHEQKPLFIYVAQQTHVSGPALDAIKQTGGDVIKLFQ